MAEQIKFYLLFYLYKGNVMKVLNDMDLKLVSGGNNTAVTVCEAGTAGIGVLSTVVGGPPGAFAGAAIAVGGQLGCKKFVNTIETFVNKILN
ncbi:hypothetical protein [Serratia sp. OS31]|uniref:hypothetical protein n=1 Tax=Serratia sp. OS31 TaxID=2760844 RepID=UPI00160393A0|nr:hypothetical protein [Serratia sp. OS31]MBB1585183.1 hypothetical protein [Serratia sp. OS31]